MQKNVTTIIDFVESYYCDNSAGLRQQSVQVVGLLKYSGQSDNTAAQKIYNESNVHTKSTPRYMQAVRNHIQVGAR